MNYTVSANRRRLEVADSSYIVSYTTSYLMYGEVQVSAINTCGQESQPAAINIHAKGDCTESVKCHCSNKTWTPSKHFVIHTLQRKET